MSLPTDPGVVFLGSVLCDPGEGPWGGGAPHGPSLLPRQSCPDCHDTGWVEFPDPFIGGTLDARCPACGGDTR